MNLTCHQAFWPNSRADLLYVIMRLPIPPPHIWSCPILPPRSRAAGGRKGEKGKSVRDIKPLTLMKPQIFGLGGSTFLLQQAFAAEMTGCLPDKSLLPAFCRGVADRNHQSGSGQGMRFFLENGIYDKKTALSVRHTFCCFYGLLYGSAFKVSALRISADDLTHIAPPGVSCFAHGWSLLSAAVAGTA